MERTGKLNERQVAVLRWIGDGCPAGVLEGVTYKTTAQALKSRGLVAISKRGGWHATLTDAGTYYLEHGRHPDHVRVEAGAAKNAGKLAAGGATSMPRQRVRVGDVPIGVRDFMARLERDQGEIKVLDPAPAVRAAWRRILHAARASDELPDGWHLLHRGRDSGDLVIELRPGTHPASQYAKPFISRIQLPDALAQPHPVVAELRDHPARLPKSDHNRVRMLSIAQGLIDQLKPRGLTASRCDAGPAFMLGDDHSRTVITFDEESGARWTLRLSVQVAGPGRGDVQRWVDRQGWKVEDGLGTVADYIAEQVDAVRRRKEEQARLQREQQAKQRQHEITEHNLVILLEQVAAWEEAEAIRSHCHQLEASAMPADDAWLALAREQADLIDPLTNPPGPPPPPQPGKGRKLEPQTPKDKPPFSYPPPSEPWHPNRRWWNR